MLAITTLFFHLLLLRPYAVPAGLVQIIVMLGLVTDILQIWKVDGFHEGYTVLVPLCSLSIASPVLSKPCDWFLHFVRSITDDTSFDARDFQTMIVERLVPFPRILSSWAPDVAFADRNPPTNLLHLKQIEKQDFPLIENSEGAGVGEYFQEILLHHQLLSPNLALSTVLGTSLVLLPMLITRSVNEDGPSSGADFCRCCKLPQGSQSRFLLSLLAVVSQPTCRRFHTPLPPPPQKKGGRKDEKTENNTAATPRLGWRNNISGYRLQSHKNITSPNNHAFLK